MIEVLKQIVEALEWCHGGEPIGTAEAIKAGKQAIAELESQEPFAWAEFDGEGGYRLMLYENNETYADDWNKTNPNHIGWVEPIYKHPPQRTEPVFCEYCGGNDENPPDHCMDCARPQRTWVGLTTEERNDCLVSADPCEALAEPEAEQLMEDIEAKLKQKNGFAEENT
jgi:hypothetical protein